MLKNSKLGKILILTTWDKHIGGGQTHINLLVRNLAKNKYRVVLFQTTRVERLLTQFFSALFLGLSKYENISYFHNYAIRPRYIEIRLKILSLFFKPDIIQAEDPLSVIIAKKVYLKTPIVQTIHGPLLEHSKENGLKDPRVLDYLQQIEVSSFSISDRIIAVDTGQAELAIKKGAKRESIHVIYNAIDEDELLNLAKQKSTAQIPYLLIARRLVPKNGVQFGLLGYAKSNWAQKTRLLIAGDGNELPHLKELVKQLKIENQVVFLGPVSHQELIPMMAGASVSIVPSIPYEGVIEATSLSALESLALGVPTIASNIGGLKEIDGGTNCISLVPPGDELAISQTINWLLENPDAAKRQAVVGKERIKNAFGVDQWIDKIIALYQATFAESSHSS